MSKADDRAAVRRLLDATDNFIAATRRVTRRSLANGTEVEAARFKLAKQDFSVAKDALIGAIDAIDPESQLGKNIEELFDTDGFTEILQKQLEYLEAADEQARNLEKETKDIVRMSAFDNENQILEFESNIIKRINFGNYRLLEKEA